MSERPSPTRRRWRDLRAGLTAYADRRVLLLAPLGFAAGVPLTLVLITISTWLTEAGLSKANIALFAWVGMAYAWKFAWAPLVDRLKIPVLGRLMGHRRSWMLVTQLLIFGALLGLSYQDPIHSPGRLAAWAVLVAFLSATHDIALDGWRVQVLERDLQGNGASTYQLGYRLAILACGAGALTLAAFFRGDSEIGAAVARSVVQTVGSVASLIAGHTTEGVLSATNVHMASEIWPKTYRILAFLMGVGVLATLFAPEPSAALRGESEEEDAAGRAPVWERFPDFALLQRVARWPRAAREVVDAALGPFLEFALGRRSVGFAAVLLLFVIAFRLSDSIAGALVQTFMIELGFEYTQIATIQKVFGTIMTLVGTFLGGALFRSLGAIKTLWIAGVLQVGSNLMFVYQAHQGADPVALHLTISVENLSGGLSAGAFVAYLSNLCSIRYSATQYALLSALAMIGRTMIAGSVGGIADTYGWSNYFLFSAAAGIPGLILLAVITRMTKDDDPFPDASQAEDAGATGETTSAPSSDAPSSDAPG